MKNFIRSLVYLRPSRLRLSVAVVCVVLIAALWAGGLGAMLPGLKILISEEGLHGWAWDSLTEDKLGVTVVRRNMEGIEGFPVTVLDVVRVDEDSPAERAGLGANEFLFGIGDDQPVPANALARRIADAEPGTPIKLWVFSRRGPAAQRLRKITLTPAEPETSARLLGWVSRRIREPEDRLGRYPVLLMLVGVGIAITLLRDVLRFIQEYLVETAVWRGVVNLRTQMYHHVLKMPVSHFSSEGTSDTMSRFLQDSNELARGQSTLFGKTLVEPAKAVASVGVALWFSWRLTLLALVAGPPAVLLIRVLAKRMKRASRRALENWSQMLAALEETLTGLRVVKSYTMETDRRRRFMRINRGLFKQQRRMSRVEAATSPAVEAMGIVAAMGAVALAGYWVLNPAHDMDGETFIALVAALAAMFDPVRKLAKVSTRFQRAEAAATRVFELIDRSVEPRTPGAPSLGRHSRSLAFSNVWFRYPGSSEDVLRGVDLEIGFGQNVAIVGPNGCGKTTLVSLVPRLLEPTSGAVLVDERDISRHSIRSLREQIGLVTQDSVLFHASIRENIACGRRGATDEQVLEAARRAYVDEFVSDPQIMPDGYDTIVGEHGATLSGGQRQRICIARAILRDPSILIFDEAMSQIDADSERRIHQAMESFVQGRTSLMIAHRFSTVLSADRIVVMEAGRIVDVGRHGELLERCRLYQHLYRTQLQPDE
jgi:ABC-type multidrug transport system fused ATPase/permease subunit